MEKLGIPGVFLVSSQFLADAKSAAADWAMPGIRIVTVPSDKWYRLRGTVEGVRPLAEAALDPIIKILFLPLLKMKR